MRVQAELQSTKRRAVAGAFAVVTLLVAYHKLVLLQFTSGRAYLTFERTADLYRNAWDALPRSAWDGDGGPGLSDVEGRITMGRAGSSDRAKLAVAGDGLGAILNVRDETGEAGGGNRRESAVEVGSEEDESVTNEGILELSELKHGATASEVEVPAKSGRLEEVHRISEETVESGMGGPTPGRSEANETTTKCASYIYYDKPAKTGSSTITQALKRMLKMSWNASSEVCERTECLLAARAICAGKRAAINLVQHISGEHGLVECLRSRGFYAVTSVRDPLQRWESAFLYNRMMRARHYGIHFKSGYGEFMSRMPACALLSYYDGLDSRCKGPLSVEERVRRIVVRYDEVVDLYDDGPGGQVYALVRDTMVTRGQSPRPGGDFREPFDRTRLRNETILYKALRRRRAELLREPSRKICRL